LYFVEVLSKVLSMKTAWRACEMGHKLTDTQVKAWVSSGTIKKGSDSVPARTLSEQLGERGAGSMLLERRPTGVVEVYLALRRDGKQERRKLGSFGEMGSDGLTRGLAYWRKDAERVSAEVRRFSTLAAFDEHQRQQTAMVERAASLEARQGSFEQLLAAYVEDMRRKGKSSAKDVQGSFNLNVLSAFPALATRKAKEIQPGDITEILRHCLNRPPAKKGRGSRKTTATASNGKLTTANRLRAYLRAAFAFGLKNDLSPQRSGGAVQFGLSHNPVTDLPTIEGAERANTEALSKDELRHLLAALDGLSIHHQAIARAMLYLAGQRVEMLCRATWDDLLEDPEHGPLLRLVDFKGGKGTPPRDHLLPIGGRLAEVLAPLLQRREAQPCKLAGPFALSARPLSPDTALKIFSDLGSALAEKGLTRRFTWRTMRATIETHLAELGTDEQRRAWLLSHGRSGVQAKHYDRYSYVAEKCEDLARWARYLDALAGLVPVDNVVKIRGRAQ
jgi:integrase